MFKIKEIKDMSFDVFHRTGEYMDHWKLNFNELGTFLSECEEIYGRKWESIYLDTWKVSDSLLCHYINIFNKHNYIVCLTGEIYRDLRGNLHGQSSLLDYALNSNYKERCEKNRIKKYGVKKV